MQRMAVFFLAAAACGSNQGPGSPGTPATPTPTPRPDAVQHNAYAASTVADLPACDSSRRGDLFFIESDKTFQVCESNGWTAINLQGPAGPAGAPGAPGKDATAQSLFASSIGCFGPLGTTPIRVGYAVAILKTGDVLATGQIRNNSFEVSETSFYAKTQAGAATAQVVLSYDLAGPANYGFWVITLDRMTLITTVTYFDADVAGGQTVWTLTSDKCVVNNYP